MIALNPEFALGFRQNVSKSSVLLRFARKSVLAVLHRIRLRFFYSQALSCKRFRPFSSKPNAKSGLKTLRILGISLVIVLSLCSLTLCVETITIDTYYPSPYGSYKELRAQQMIIGETFYGPAYCWPPNTCANRIDPVVDLVVEGSVGIGTTAPGGPLQVRTASGVGFVVTTDGRVGIGMNNPNSSAKLAVYSTNSGFLPPRMTTAQRDAVASPAEGLMLYNTDTDLIQYYNGSDWIDLGGSGEQLLGVLDKFTSYTLTNTTNWQKIYTWMAGSILNPCRSAGDLVGCRVDDSTASYAIEINLSSFGRGIYTIEWGADVSVDGKEGKGMYLALQATAPGAASWVTLDTTDLLEDTDADNTNPEPDSIYTSYTIDPRIVTLPLNTRNWERFRILARKNGGDAAVVGWVGDSAYIQISRQGSL